MTVTHDDARYAQALAAVAERIAALEATLARGRRLIAELALPLCPECGKAFQPTDPRQFLCTAPECHRRRHARQALLWVARRRRHNPLGTNWRPQALEGTCVCGAELCFTVGLGGVALEACPRPTCAAHAWHPTPRRTMRAA